jgi:hypothetical protein
MTDRTAEEQKIYEFEQKLLSFDKKDCIFCEGAKCDACSQSGRLDRVMDEAHYRRAVERINNGGDEG